jgi:hypothetical protein
MLKSCVASATWRLTATSPVVKESSEPPELACLHANAVLLVGADRDVTGRGGEQRVAGACLPARKCSVTCGG